MIFSSGGLDSVGYSTAKYPLVSVSGSVRESTFSKSYTHSSVVINEKKERIQSYYCSCTQSRNRICPHCVAIALLYAFARENGDVELPDPDKEQDTNRFASNFLYDVSDSLAPDSSGSYFIQPFAEVSDSPSDHSLTFTFRVGKIGQRAYVLNSIQSLIEAEMESEPYSLGKKNQFIPSPSAFSPEYRPLYELLRSMYAEQYLYRSYYWNYSDYYGVALGKHLSLKGSHLDDFMDAVKTCGLSCHSNSKNRKMETPLEITDEEPDFSVEFRKKDKGIEFRSTPLFLYTGARYFYILSQDKTKLHRIPADHSKNFSHFLEFISSIGGKSIYINSEDVRPFITSIRPLSAKLGELKSSGFELADYLPPTPEFSFYLDLPQDNMITCEAYASYGNNRYSIFKITEDDRGRRNPDEEHAMENLISPLFNSYDPDHLRMAVMNDEDLMVHFINEGIPLLQSKGTVYISDKLKRLQIRTLNHVSFGVSMQNDLLQLQLTSDSRTLEDLAEILSRYTPKKKYYRLRDGSFIHIEDEEEIRELSQFSEDLDLSSADIRSGSALLPSYRAMYIDKTASENNRIEVSRDAYFEDLINQIEDTDAEYDIPESLNAIMREYQKDGFRWLRRLYSTKFSGLLADEMGLGKTLQIIALIASLPDRGPCLIVCPASLVYNWKNEFRKFAPEIHAEMITGTPSVREELIKTAPGSSVLITSYDALKRDLPHYDGIRFDIEVIDEAQYIKNPATKAAESVKSINSRFRAALTGTPIENRLSELWSIFDYLMPGFLYRYTWFRTHYETPIIKKQNPDIQARLKKMISPFILRRRKMNVLKDLPEKLEEVYYAPLEGEQKELYEARKQRLKIMLGKTTDADFNKNRIQILAEITRLRQTCCSPDLIYEDYKGNSAKEDLCIDLITTAIEEGHKVLLFSQFKSMLEKLNLRLEKEGISYHFLCGDTPKEKRAEMVESFQEDDVPVFSISLKAGGTGLNLTAADIVIHYDPWWNTAVENQASDRAHRIGQQNIVTVYRLIVQDTIEERILQLQSQKSDLANEILSGDDISRTTFTREQLMEIL